MAASNVNNPPAPPEGQPQKPPAKPKSKPQKVTFSTTTVAPPAPQAQPEPIPAHAFAGVYQPNFLAEWIPEECQKYAHLNCSFFSHATGVAPNLLQLKQHAQAMCNLFKTLTAIDHQSDTDDAFDWLEDLDTPYANLGPTHSLPLNSLRNQIAETQDSATGATILSTGCTLAEDTADRRSLCDHIEHVNDLLEYIDNETAPDGGLFSILPSQHDPARQLTKDTILGQWLIYTTTLVQRVAELEAEIANSRDVLAGEATAPLQLSSTGRMAEGKPLLFPQDRYVLANLTPDSWDVLNEQLAAKQEEQEATERAAAQNLHAPATKDGEQAVDPLEPVASMDVMSRVYRIPGSRTIFINPGYAIHPGTKATRTMETRPLVQTVVRPEVGTRTTARGRRENTQMNELQNLAQTRNRQILALRHQLQTTTAELNTTRHNLQLTQLRAGEGRESERAQLAKIMADKAAKATKVEEEKEKAKAKEQETKTKTKTKGAGGDGIQAQGENGGKTYPVVVKA